MAEEFSRIAKEIIDFQKESSIPDTQFAFNLHMSVERLHDIKAMEVSPTNEEIDNIDHFVEHNKL